jgi:LmbE family N-acetylglucosaminyl deacetylase
VPNVAPDTPSLRKNPAFFYYEDNFQKPQPFAPDVAVSIDDTFEKKIAMLDAHVSQFYEWLPWLDGRFDEVPKDAAARRAWLTKGRFGRISPAVRGTLEKYYGKEAAAKVQHAEAFEICEYGRRPTPEDIKRLFPFLP